MVILAARRAVISPSVGGPSGTISDDGSCSTCVEVSVPSESIHDVERLQAAHHSGDGLVFEELLGRYRDRLRKMVRLWLDDRLRGRVDPSDVIQETYLEASRRLNEFLAKPDVSFFVWIRFLARQQLAQTHRRHLGAQARDAARDVSLLADADAESPRALAAQLACQLTSPSTAAMRSELQQKLQELLNGLDPLDREILVLRHFEKLSNLETAQSLGLKPTAASNRYVRAIERLKQAVATASWKMDELL